jgi:uncharacterized phage protein gp47/JayE
MTDLADFTELFSETLARVRARLDADANAGLTQDDPDWVDTREGGFYFDVTQPPAMEMARLWDAMTEAAAAAFPSTAWGDYLDEHGATVGLTRSPSQPAAGQLVFVATAPVLIATGTQASSVATTTGDVITFQTTDGGTTCPLLTTPANVQVSASQTGGHLVAGTRYYHVTALNQFGETLASLDQAAITSSNVGQNTITWQAVSGASSYQVYVTTVPATAGQLVGSTVGTTFIDNGTITPSILEPTLNTTSGIVLDAQATATGTAGNVSAGAITSLDTVLASVYSVNNPAAFEGGQDDESDDDFRTEILGEYQGTSGGGNAADYRRWVVSQGIERASVIPIWSGAGTVMVVIMQADGSPVLASEVTAIQSYLDPVQGQGQGQAPIGASVTVTTSTLLMVQIACYVTPVSGYSLDGKNSTIAYRQSIYNALTAYLNSLGPGDVIAFEHVQACFFVPGVLNISGTVVNGQSSGTIQLSSSSSPQVARLAISPPTWPNLTEP